MSVTKGKQKGFKKITRTNVRRKKSSVKKTIRASKWDRERTAKLYTCGVHFMHEMTEAMGPQIFYNSLTDLKQDHSCWKSCGIVEVKVSFTQWLHPETIGEGMNRARMMSSAETAKFDKQSKLRADLRRKYISDLKKIHKSE